MKCYDGNKIWVLITQCNYYPKKTYNKSQKLHLEKKKRYHGNSVKLVLLATIVIKI